MATAKALKNIIVVGGSYVGKSTAQELARSLPTSHRVLLIEPHSHFHHLFAFPRFAVLPGHEEKAFIPYTGLFSSIAGSVSGSGSGSRHSVIQARVLSIAPNYVNLDKAWSESNSQQIPFEYLVLATGTRLSEPAGMKDDDKVSSVKYLRGHQEQIKRAGSILIAGGGAVGVQMATDLKEIYPEKRVTVVQSRPKLMPQYHGKLDQIIRKRFEDLGVEFITGSRIKVPESGFPKETPFTVHTTAGTELPGKYDFVILATGQTPNNDLINTLPVSTSNTSGSLINPDNGFIRIRPTMQFADEAYPHLFAVGDIADTGLRKAARPGNAQAQTVVKNILALVEGVQAREEYPRQPAGIHLSLGLKHNIVFRNPNEAEGQTEPTVIERDDGRDDMGVEGWWERLGVKGEGKEAPQYHL
ncbi:NAD(P)/FAD-dependent oxidoreductase [Aspergillus stella-maris]|uniref:NAD(P)/FAD-dependent oxidoreductase n=1 Tax=Aspergillus stella-maris TaxID=1810926 RepID=UPI003CCDF146